MGLRCILITLTRSGPSLRTLDKDLVLYSSVGDLFCLKCLLPNMNDVEKLMETSDFRPWVENWLCLSLHLVTICNSQGSARREQITQLLCLKLMALSATWSVSRIRFTALIVLMVCLPLHRAGLREVLVCLLQMANKSRLLLIGNYKPRQMTPLFVISVDA